MQYQTSPELESFVEATHRPATLIELLDQKALQRPGQLAYTFLLDGETSELHLTYGKLKRRAQAIAAALRIAGAKGGRALLLYPPGLDFIEGFFGCLYAGVVPVPAYPPDPVRLNRTLPRLQAVIADAQATLVLTTSPIMEMAKLIFTEAPDLKALHWFATDTVVTGADEDSQPEHASAGDLAFLQYTSGSTGHPRGVMLTHANLLHNASLIFHVYEHTEADSYVSWLPMFHDMGFMMGVLQPLYAGIRSVVMSPASFLQRPARWLEAISRYRASTSGGPNFAYNLCARKVPAEDAAALDLSSWSVAFNGAEPVRAETLDRFASRFGPCGFRRATFCPGYGLAEATLMVTSGRKASLPMIKWVEATAPEKTAAVETAVVDTKSKLMVGCGRAMPGQRVIIVDRESLTELDDGQVGEIWVSGPSVATGYWNRPEETNQTFNAYLLDSGEGPFLRTEDLGFIEDGELYITGRIKDLIIIRGLNHYPQDIEWTVERCHAALRPGCGAAFTIDAGGEERLVIVQEIDARKEADLDQVIETIREAVASEHDLQVYAVALIKPRQISKTSSGKIQRRDSRRKFLEGTLDAVAEWRAAASEEGDAPELVTAALSAEAINLWLASQVAAKLGIPSSDLRMDQPLARYGLDSLIAVELAHFIETRLGVTLPMVSFLQGSSIVQLSAEILSQLSECPGPQGSPAAGRESENEYPLSHGQRGLWFLHNFAPESAAYNIARAVKIRAALDIAALRRAFSVLLERHAALRTTFATSRGRPIQRVADRVDLDFRQEYARHWTEAQLDERLTAESERSFDLERGPLLRINLFTRSSDEHILLLAAHHIIVDFWSLALLMQELGLCYEAEQSGVRAALPELSSSYSAFVRWQKELVSSEEGEKHWAYWHSQLSHELPVLNLPTTRPRPPVQTFRGASDPLPLSAATARRLKALSRKHGATLYVTLLAAFQTLLHRYTGQQKFLVGTVTAGRPKAEFAPLIGYFVNPLVLRAIVSGDATFESLLAQVRESVLDAFAHQDYPFSILVERLQAARDPSRSPLLQVMFSMHKAHLPGEEGLSLFALGEAGARLNLGGLELESVPLKQRVAQFDLTLMMAEAGEELYATFEYNTDLFDAATIGQMAQSFRILLDAVVANPAERISRLPVPRGSRVDRRALPPLDGVAVRPKKSFEAPRTEIEQMLATIWSELLGIKSISVNDNFFEMGGDSILSIQVVARAAEAGIDVTPRQLFQHQTIAELATEVAAAGTLRRPTESTFEELGPVKLDQRQLQALEKDGGEIEDIYPPTPTQQGMLFHSLSEPDSGVYMTQLICELSGALDVAPFEAAWQKVVSRHQSLRADFAWDVCAEPIQVVRREVQVKLSCEDWREFNRERQNELLDEWLRRDSKRGFDLRRAPLLRLALFRRSDEEQVFVLSNHHLLIDGWSLSIVLQEVFATYDARSASRAPRLKHSRSFKDYVAWLRRQDDAGAESFWRETLHGFTEPTPLGVDNAYGNLAGKDLTDREEAFSEESLRLSEASTESLQALARQNRLTLSTLLYGAWAILLSRYSGERDIVFGVTSSGRPPDLRGSEAMVGLFINTLPLRVCIPPGQLLIPWLKELQKRLVELRQYEYSSLLQVQEWSEVQRGRALFESIFVFENYPVDSSLTVRRKRPEITALRSIEQTNYPLTIAAAPGAELALHAGYKTDRFDTATICRMLQHLETLLENMITDPHQRVTDLSLLSATERNLLIRKSSETQADFPSVGLHQIFERQAAATPNAVALIFEGERLSYHELNCRANQLAHHLRGLGLKRGTRVGICLERSPAMIIGLLGILKAGGAYLPLDPEYPKERLAFMLADAQPEMVITTQPLLENLPEHGASVSYVVCLFDESDSISQQSEENPRSFTFEEDLAYVIYTSGSTGQPKGVMISHRSVSNLMQWTAREFPLDQSDRMLLKYSISFDAAIEEIFHPLISGAGLVIVPPGCQYDVGYLVELMCEQQVTAIDLVPTMLNALIEDARIKKCRSLLRVTSGGEVLSAELKDRVYRLLGEVELVNMYGPTEAAITTTYYRCALGRDERTVPIGRPGANTRVYILDQDLEPVPVGVPGEIYIGGKGLAWGYLNQPWLTAEKFIPDPLSGDVGARLYKSGDWGRYSGNGNLEYVGRLDGQVKVRGFRIELREIEAALKNHKAVIDAMVIVREQAEGDKRLVAYVVCDREDAVTPEELRAYLKDKLPQYMLPAAVVLLDALPFKGSGKVDVRALPAPEEIKNEEDLVAPQTHVEKELVRIWKEVLGLERVGVTDNFFELGGDSIISIQIVARARDAGLLITPQQVLKHGSILDLAAVTKTSSTRAAEEESVEPTIPLIPIQYWFLEQQLPNPHHYNQAVMLELKQPVRIDLLEKTLARLIEHHEALRLRFDREAGGWKQTVTARETHQIFERADLSFLTPEAQTAEIKRAADQAQSSLHLSEGPIIRAVYFDLGIGRSHRLLIVIHHLAVDGVSWRILLDDLQRTYEQLRRDEAVKLPSKTLSFKRWSELLSAHAQYATVLQELEYWTAELHRNVGKLPVDRAGDNNGDSARSLSVALTAEETRLLLQEVPRAYRTQINDVLLAALAQALSEWTGDERVLVDVEGHGREEIVEGCDLSRTVGWFTTIFPVLLEVSNSSGLGETLKSVKEQLRRVPNRGIGYGLLRYLGGDETVSSQLEKLPQAQVSFNYLGQLDQVFRDDETTAFVLTNDPVGQSRGDRGRRKYLIDIDGGVRDGRLQMEWIYSNELHARQTIEAVAESFIRKLRRLIEHCVLREVREYTPSDFPLVNLNERQLAQIQRTAGQIEDLYPLSPMQEGMLFHSLYGPDSAIYTTQLVCELKGHLNEDMFETAWQAAVDAHAVLRTVFEWKAVEEPLQVVRRSVKVRLKREDWKSLGRGGQADKLEAYLRQDREQGFDLNQPPLMRLALVRTTDDASLFIWTSHHLLLDGWSLPIVLNDVFTAYDRLRGGEQAWVKPARSYRDYITWVKKQDLKEAEIFWRQLLKRFASPTPLGTRRTPAPGNDDSQYTEQQVQLAESATARLREFAQSNQLTPNTVVQGAWALLLSSHTGREDVVFGVVVSGRSVEVADVESMVGLIINTLPTRAKITPEAELIVWLKQLQEQQAEMVQYEYCPLAQVQRWSEVEQGKPLFESIFLFENYPVASVADGSVRVGSVRSVERSNYPLTVWAIPGQEFVLKIGYDTRRFEDEWINKLLRDYETLLEAITSGEKGEALCLKSLLPTKKHKTHKLNC
jgi:amino acid adenylation domain-containing protein/non-ribosomal peptide synthase protein (TIGR01720 family)